MGDKSEQLSYLCKALSHPVRVRILETLLARDACYAGELVDELAAPRDAPQKVHQRHPRHLRRAGTTTCGRCTYVCM